MSPRYDAEWVASMLSDQRAALASPESMLRTLGLQVGDIVVDVGCGPGFLTLPAARLVGARGHVYAVDVEPAMLRLVEQRAGEHGLGNVTTVASTGERVPLPDASGALIICSLVLHSEHASGRAGLASELTRLCLPGGSVLVIEWLPVPGQERWDRMPPSEAEGLLSNAGLIVDRHGVLGYVDRHTSQKEGMYQVVGRRPT